MAREWLDREPRLRASILVAPQDAELAAAEIERCAADERFVQVLLLVMGDRPLGHRTYWPIYRRRGAARPADRYSCRLDFPPGADRLRLAVLSPG